MYLYTVQYIYIQCIICVYLQDPTTDPGRDKLEAACTGGACAGDRNVALLLSLLRSTWTKC